MKNLLIVIFSISLLSGCISNSFQAQENDNYTLVDNVSPATLNSNIELNVEVASPLNKGFIVVKTSDVSLRVTNSHKWSQKLEDQLSLLAINELLKYPSISKYKYEINVLQFYGSTEGRVFISLACKVQNGSKIILIRDYSQDFLQNEDGYDALAESLKEGYVKIINRIIADLL